MNVISVDMDCLGLNQDLRLGMYMQTTYYGMRCWAPAITHSIHKDPTRPWQQEEFAAMLDAIALEANVAAAKMETNRSLADHRISDASSAANSEAIPNGRLFLIIHLNRVVSRCAPKGLTPRTGLVLIRAAVGDDALPSNGKLEAEQIAVSVWRQMVWANGATIENDKVIGRTKDIIAGIGEALNTKHWRLDHGLIAKEGLSISKQVYRKRFMPERAVIKEGQAAIRVQNGTEEIQHALHSGTEFRALPPLFRNEG